METSGAVLAGLLALGCAADAGTSGTLEPQKPTSCNGDATCIGSYLMHRDTQSGDCVATSDRLVVLDGKPSDSGCTIKSEVASPNGCKDAIDETCPDGTHLVGTLEIQDSNCDLISGLETLDVPGVCSGTLNVTLTRQ